MIDESIKIIQPRQLKGPGDFSPPDPTSCPESCPHCPESRNPDDCPLLECRYEWDKDDYGDIKYHEQF